MKKIAIVGPFGAGKTALLRNAFGIKPKTEAFLDNRFRNLWDWGRTQDVAIYPINDKLDIVDLPASDSANKEEREKGWNYLRNHTPDAFVIVFDGSFARVNTFCTTGHRDIFEFVARSNRPFLICVSQMDRCVQEECTTEMITKCNQARLAYLLLDRNSKEKLLIDSELEQSWKKNGQIWPTCFEHKWKKTKLPECVLSAVDVKEWISSV